MAIRTSVRPTGQDVEGDGLVLPGRWHSTIERPDDLETEESAANTSPFSVRVIEAVWTAEFGDFQREVTRIYARLAYPNPPQQIGIALKPWDWRWRRRAKAQLRHMLQRDLPLYVPRQVKKWPTTWEQKTRYVSALFETIGSPAPGTEITLNAGLVRKLMPVAHLPINRRLRKLGLLRRTRRTRFVMGCGSDDQWNLAEEILRGFGLVPHRR